MSLVRYYPRRRMSNIDRVFTGIEHNRSISMPVEIFEGEEEFTLTAEIPGFTNDEISIEVTRDSITIKAEHVEVEKSENMESDEKEEVVKDRLVYSERRSHRFARKLNFGKEIDAPKASSKLENGILTLVLPKAEKEKAVKLVPQMN